MVEATFRGSGLQLTLQVEHYELPDSETGWDANWLVARARSTPAQSDASTQSTGSRS
jgi:hypothetical protein